jgi:ElaB/YqjD/DUF883 family membrane-anchored ribosome-binding protein
MDETTSSPELKRDFDKLRADFDRLVKDLTSAAQRGRDVAMRSGSEALSAAKEQVDVVSEDLSRRVRENPLTACAIAAGAGVILGLLISSGRK